MLMRMMIALGFVAAVACGPALPPTATTFDAKAVFHDLSKGASRPMVVDWSADDRGALEVHTAHGPILVRVTDNGIEPLWDCSVSDGGTYEYTGVSPKRDHVDARSDAELAANFPMSFLKLRGMVKSGQSISADVRIIGLAELNRLSVHRVDLPAAQCQSATHFVKELTIGGFQFGSGAASAAGAGVGTALENAGAEARYVGVSNRITEEGDFKTCEEADPDARTAPARCKGILRIRLVPIDQDATQQTQTTCGGGMRWDGRACVQVDAPPEAANLFTAPPYECNEKSYEECLEQCKKGNAPSCTHAADIMLKSRRGMMADIKRLYTLGCNGKHWDGCSGLAVAFQAERNDVEAARLYGIACVNGFSEACVGYGIAAYFGRGVNEDRGLAYRLWSRACRLGEFVACSNAGVIVNAGQGGVARDHVAARKMFQVACKNGKQGGCTNYAMMLENGVGGPKDRKQAFSIYSTACDLDDNTGCVNAGLLIEEGAPNDMSRVARALSLYEKACGRRSLGDGCASSAETRDLFGKFYNAEQVDRRSCDGSTLSELGCYNAAVVYADARSGLKNDQKMAEFAKRACKSAQTTKPLCSRFR